MYINICIHTQVPRSVREKASAVGKDKEVVDVSASMDGLTEEVKQEEKVRICMFAIAVSHFKRTLQHFKRALSYVKRARWSKKGSKARKKGILFMFGIALLYFKRAISHIKRAL